MTHTAAKMAVAIGQTVNVRFESFTIQMSFIEQSIKNQEDIIMEEKSYTITELIEIAQIDQSDDDSRPWNFTNNCGMCGGTAAFLYWLEDHQMEEN